MSATFQCPFFFLNIGLWWNQHCGQILRSEETQSIPLVYTLWILYSGLYRNGNSVEALAVIDWLAYCTWSFLTSRDNTYLGDQQDTLILNQETEIELETHVLFQFCWWKYFLQMALIIERPSTNYLPKCVSWQRTNKTKILLGRRSN